MYNISNELMPAYGFKTGDTFVLRGIRRGRESAQHKFYLALAISLSTHAQNDHDRRNHLHVNAKFNKTAFCS